MIMHRLRIFFLILVIILTFNNCSSVKKAFDPERKNGSDEFLVEKKSPLSMPPDFDELPIPQDQNTQIEEKDGELKVLLEDMSKSNNQLNNQEQDNSEIESSIIEKIKNN